MYIYVSRTGIRDPDERKPLSSGVRMKIGHWLGSVLCVSVSALMLLVGQ